MDPALRAKADAADLVQDSLLECQQAFHSFRGTRLDELVAWLKQILAHNIANVRRRYLGTEKRDVHREVSIHAHGPYTPPGDYLESDSIFPDEKAVRREELERLLVAVDQLPEQPRVVIVWRSQDGLSFEEIGLRLGITPESARQVWWRAVYRLRTQLAESCDTR